MRLRLLGIVLLTLFFLLAAAILWPASALAPWIERGSNGHWRLANTEGSIWSGNGLILTHSADGSAWQIAQSVRWQLRWGELWRGRVTIETAYDQGSSLIVATPDSVSLEQIDATLPAPMLLLLLPGALGRYGWGGSIHLRGDAFRCTWQNRACDGEIELLWNDAAVVEVPGNTLGDYRFRLVAEGRALRTDLSTLRGRLQINGSGEVAANGLRFKGEATATGSDAGALDAMLRTLGSPAGSPGKYLIDYREPGTSR